MRQWPMKDANDSVVPSRIGYDRGVPAGYGDGILPGAEVCSWTKLLLDRSVNSLEFADEAMREMLGSGTLHLPAALSPCYVISDFLRYVHHHASDHMPEIDREDTQVEYYFTVPATWSQETRGLLRSAAIGAQFERAQQRERVYVIDESEAATLSVLAQCQNALEVCPRSDPLG